MKKMKNKQYRVIYIPSVRDTPEWLVQRRYWIGWLTIKRFSNKGKAVDYLEYKKGNPYIIV